MYKLLIVDDEAVIRRGIANSNPWESWGFQVTGLCSNGIEALEMIKKDPPHIVLSDIRMPQMDGVELMQILNAHYPDIKIIILSGYSDFEYLNMSIKNNVVEYLLKPTDIEAFEHVFAKMKQQLDQAQAKDEEYHHLKSVYEEGQEYRRSKWMSMLLFGYLEGNMLSQAKQELEDAYQISMEHCILLLISKDGQIWDEEKNTNNVTNEIVEIANHTFTYENVHFILTQEETIVGFLDANWDYKKLHKFLIDMQKKIREQCHITVSVGVSDPCMMISKLPEAYEQAKRSAYQHIFLGEETIFFYEQFLTEQPLREAYINSDLLHTALLTIKFDQIEQELKRFFSTFINHSLKQYEYLDHTCQEALFRLSRWAATRNMDLNMILADLDTTISDIKRCRSLAEKQHFLEGIFYAVMLELQKEGPVRFRKGNIAYQLQACVDEEYLSNGISLEYVARKTGISAVYASKLFKEELGCNFSEYLLKKRMEKSKELLKDITIKVYEVAEQVGYADVSNFIKVFRRYFKVSPSEYRASMGE